MNAADPVAQLHPIVDGHAHSSGEFFRGDDIIRILDGLGVAQVILSPGPLNEPRKWPVPALAKVFRKRGLGLPGNRFLRLAAGYVRRRFSFEESNGYVASLARRYPGRIFQTCWIDPENAGQMAALAARHDDWKFTSLKVHQCFARTGSDSPAMRELARFAAARNIPIFLHFYARSDAVDFLKLAAAHPETTFVIAHLLGFGVIRRADRARIANVYFDISPPNLCPLGLVRAALDDFGAERLLLGSDTPYGKDNLAAAVERVLTLDIPDGDKALILGGNARRVYAI